MLNNVKPRAGGKLALLIKNNMANNIGSLAVGMTSGILNNVLAGWREDMAANRQFSHSEQAADNADRRARKLYMDFMSPEALLQQYKNAGLSPSLMFGGGGVGGQTPTGAQGAGSQQGSLYQPIDPATGAMIQKLMAETENIKQDTKKKGAETDLTYQQVNKAVLECASQQLKNDWQAMDNICKSWETAIAQDKNEYEWKSILKRYEILEDEARSAKVRADIDEKTEDDIINYTREKVKNLICDTILKKCQGHKIFADIQFNVAQMQKMIADITTQFEQLHLNEKELKAQIEQWATQNGFTERGQNIEIAKIITNAILEIRGQNEKAFGDLLKLFSFVTIK